MIALLLFDVHMSYELKLPFCSDKILFGDIIKYSFSGKCWLSPYGR